MIHKPDSENRGFGPEPLCVTLDWDNHDHGLGM